MKSYYENENGKLYCGDCEDIMPELEKVDLVLTDPPYGIGEAAGKNKSRSKIAKAKDYGNKTWDNKPPSKECFEILLKAAEHHIIFGGNYFIEHLQPSPCWIVWDKDNTGDFADCELAWTNFKTAVRKFKYRWNGMLQENSGKHKEKRYHPTQKPVGLFKQILLKYSEEGQTILDPFAGVGTTGLACEDLGKRKYILIEQEEKYCEITAMRLEAENKQLKMF